MAESKENAETPKAKPMLKNGPELAQLQIRLLDQMVHQLKQRRLNAGVQMQKDEDELKWVSREMDDINKKLAPLVKELNEKKDLKADLEKRKENCKKQFEEMTNLAKTQLHKSTKSENKLTSKQTSFHLAQTRGYTMDSGTSKTKTPTKK